MKLRFVSWNVNNRNPTPRHINILREAQPDILVLQEVCPAFHDVLAAEDVFTLGAFSLNIRQPYQRAILQALRRTRNNMDRPYADSRNL
jgi:hypothetical protein